MPDLLGVTNPVPGHDSNITNRNIPISPNNTQVQNVPDLNRVTSADNRTEQIANLEEMRGYLHEYETDLIQMTDSTLAKLRKMSDSEFFDFRRSADFDLAALGHV